jgi:DNA mismatch repair protein MutL
LLFLAVQDALRSAAVVQPQPGMARADGTGWSPGSADAGSATDGSGLAVDTPGQGALFREEAPAGGRDRFGEVVGQLHDTFLVAATQEEVFFIDQHVAHERVLFERLQAELGQGPLPSQNLLFAQPLELAPADVVRLGEWTPTLARLGFALEGFGGSTVIVRAIPALLGGREPRRLIERLLEEVSGPGREGEVPLVDRALSFLACRAAIKAPAPLEREEMRRLLGDLGSTREPYFCPHGRPIVSRLSLRDIRRELRRTW